MPKCKPDVNLNAEPGSMLPYYDDIRSRIAEEPSWWDESGCPRYGGFGPNQLAEVYADEAALVEIACKGCGRLFRVAFSRCAYERTGGRIGREMADDIREGRMLYGCPPNVRCCVVGNAVSSESRRVVEYWRRREAPTGMEWQRDLALEIDIEPDWVVEDDPGE